MLNWLKKTAVERRDQLLKRFVYQKRIDRAAIVRKRIRPLLKDLPSVPLASAPAFEIHMVCGKRDLDMGILSSWSLMRHLEGQAGLLIHSDGSLAEEHMAEWRRVIPDMQVVYPDQAQVSVSNSIKGFPTLYDWWHSWGSSSTRQVVDSHLFGNTSRILIMDSDVLCLKRPDRLLSEFAQDQNAYAWCDDIRSSYIAPVVDLSEVAQRAIPAKLNCGFMLAPRFNSTDFDFLEEQLVRIKGRGIQYKRYWSAQTLYALAASRSDRRTALGDGYDNTAGAVLPNTVIRHFVGHMAVRYRFFTEGAPLLLSEAGLSY